MKSKYILMTLAMSLQMNAYSQTASSPSQILSKLEAPTLSKTLSADQRAAKMPALALIPSDASICISVQGFSKTVKDILDNPMIKGMMGQNQSAGAAIVSGVASVKDLTFAMGAGADKMIDASLPLVKTVAQMSSTLSLMDGLQVVSPEFSPDAASVAAHTQKNILLGLQQYLSADQVSPCLLVVSLEDAALPQVKAMLDGWFKNNLPSPNFSNEGISPHEGKYAGLDFKGLKVEGKKLAQSKSLKATMTGVDTPNVESVLAEVAKHDLYVLYAYQGDKLIISISKDPVSQIKIAATPKESILATDKLAFTDKAAQSSMILGYGDAAVYASILKYAAANVDGQLQGYKDALQKMNLGDISGIITALNAMKSDYDAIVKLSKANQPLTALVWGDKGLQVEVEAADDGTLIPAKAVKISSFADEADNILFYAGSSSAAYTSKAVSLAENAVSAGWQFMECIVPVLAKQEAQQKNPQIQQFLQTWPLIQASKPELLKLWGACKLALSGFGGESALVIDSKGSMPLIPGVPPEMAATLAKLQIPCVALAANVTDRKKLATAWNDLLTTSGNLVQSLSPSQGNTDGKLVLPEPKKAESEDITSYCYPLPFFTTGFMPSISISDKAWVMGTSPGLNLRVAKAMAAPHTGSLTGMVFAFNFTPMLELAKTNIELLKQMGMKPNDQVTGSIFQVLDKVQGIYATKTTDGTKTRCRFSLQMK